MLNSLFCTYCSQVPPQHQYNHQCHYLLLKVCYSIYNIVDSFSNSIAHNMWHNRVMLIFSIKHSMQYLFAKYLNWILGEEISNNKTWISSYFPTQEKFGFRISSRSKEALHDLWAFVYIPNVMCNQFLFYMILLLFAVKKGDIQKILPSIQLLYSWQTWCVNHNKVCLLFISYHCFTGNLIPNTWHTNWSFCCCNFILL